MTQEEYKSILAQASQSYRNIPNWMKTIEKKLVRRPKLHDHVEILAGPYQGYYGAVVCVQGASQLFTVEIVEPSGYTLDMRDYTPDQLRVTK